MHARPALGAILALVALCWPATAQDPHAWRAGGRPTRALAAPTPHTAHPTGATQAAAIVRVWARQGEYSSGGSGTLLAMDEDRRGLVLTNRHVVAGGGRIEIHWPTGEQSAGQVEAVGGGDDDLAAIFTDVPEGIEPLELREDEPATGETLWIAGYGGSTQPFDYGPGSYQPINAVHADVNGTPARHGDSGGPIIDAEGRVAAVLWGSTGDHGGHSTACIRLPRVRRFLQKVGQLTQFSCGPCQPSGRSGGGRRGIDLDAPDVLDGGDEQASGPVPRDPGDERDDELPLAPVKPPTTPKEDKRLAELEKQLGELTKQIDTLTKLAGQPGPPGPAGPPGPPGPAGSAADSERLLALEERIERHELAIAEAIDLASRRQEIPAAELERIASAVQRKLAGSIRLQVESVPKGGTAHAMLTPTTRTTHHGR